MPSSDDFARFAFDGIGLVPVSPEVERRLMTSRGGKAFVRHSVHRASFNDWDIKPTTAVSTDPEWQVGGYLVPDSLRRHCPNPHLLIARNGKGKITVSFPTEIHR